MTQSSNHPFRNSLGPAHTAAESLYDNAVALSQIMDAYSKRNRCPDLSDDARDYITHNFLNAEEHLRQLRQALADWLNNQQEEDSEPSAVPVT